MDTDSDEMQRRAAPPYWGDTMLLCYLGTAVPVGITVCIIGIAVAEHALYGAALHEWRNRGEIGWREFEPAAPTISESIYGGAISGACLGLLGGLYLWTAAQFWRPAEHPVSASVLAASTAGSILLAILAWALAGDPSWLERYLVQAGIILACVVISAAAFGFLVTLIARCLKHQTDRWKGIS